MRSDLLAEDLPPAIGERVEPYQIDNLLEIFKAVVLIGTSTGAFVALMYTWSRVRGAGSKQVAKLAQSIWQQDLHHS